MQRHKVLTSLLVLVLVIVALRPCSSQAQTQPDGPYVPSGIPVSELGDEVPPGRLNVRFPSRDPLQVGEEISRLLQQPDVVSGGPISAQAVPTITAEIQALATGLENDPLAIYDYVHNHVDYIPSWGLLKNPRETLLAGAGNAFDQAALLVALLNAAGFQTRYVWGNVRLSKAAAMNWVGVTDPAAVGYVFANGGIPTTDGGSTLLITHIWTQVFDGGAWHSLDASFKAYSERAGKNLRSLMGYDLPTFISHAESGATITSNYVWNLNQANTRTDLATYARNLVDYLRSGDTFTYTEGLIGGRQIASVDSTTYPSSLPYTVVQQSGSANDIPQNFAYRLTVQLPGINYTVNVDDIAGERITIFYECATLADCQRLSAGGGIYNVEPAYLVNVAPKLRIGGQVVVTGSALALGTWEPLTVTISTPISGWSPRTMTQYLTAGEWYALPMRLQTVSNRALARHADLLNEAMAQVPDPDDERVLGQMIYLLGLSYFNEVDRGDRIDGRLAEVAYLRHFSVMIASRNLIVWGDWAGNAVALDPAGHTVDVRLDFASATSATNPANANRERAWFFSAGMRGSATEHAIVEQLRPVRAVSTVQILNLAIGQGQRIYYVTDDNWAAVRPALNHPDDILNAIAAYVAAGWDVVVHESELTYIQWQGSAWIALDPTSGSAAYMISGGLNPTAALTSPLITGGSTAEQERLATQEEQDKAADELMGALRAVTEPERDPTKAGTESFTSDPIDTATGTFVYHHQDLAPLGGLGIPLEFERFYASSQHTASSSLGYGWSHTYHTRFYTSTEWVRGFGGRMALEAAPALVAARVGVDLFDLTTIPHQRFAMDVTVAHWLMAQITGNAATLSEPDGALATHVRLSDGAYQPPAGRSNLDLVTIAGDCSATLDWENGTRVYLNANGRPTAFDDANGNRTALSYDGLGRLTRVSNGAGRSLTFTYNGLGRLSQVSDPLGRTFRYTYDGQGNLQAHTDPQGGVTQYAYDAAHRLAGITDPLGTAYVNNQYDALGRAVSQLDGRGGQTRLLYGGDHTIVTDPLGYRTTHSYDERGRLIGIEDALGIHTSIAYDGADHEIARTDGLGQTTRFAYEAWGHRSTTTDPLGHTTIWTYDGAGNPIRYTDQRSKAWQFTYDGHHNLTAGTDPLAGTTRYTYNSKGQLTQTQDAAGATVIYGYDTYGNLSQVTDALSETIRWSHDSAGRPLSFTNGTGQVTQFAYDATDNLLQVTDPLGHQTRYAYDANGNLLRVTDANGHATTFAWDAQFNLTRVTDALAGTTDYEYDANDGLLRISDANGHQTAYERDQVGRLVAITDPLGRRVTLTYDDADRVVAFGRADGSDVRYLRNALGWLTGIDYPSGSDVTYGYDAAGNTTTAAYGSQWSANYTYDDVGRLSTATDNGRNLTLSYTYDPAGRRSGLRVSRGTTVLHDQRYAYDAAGRLITLTDQTASPTIAVGFRHDAASRLARITDPGGARADYAYDAAGRLAQVWHQDSRGGTVATYNYTYDAEGNPIAINETTPMSTFTTTYTYDALDRLTAEAYPPYTIGYVYDPAGNLVRRTDPLGIVDYTYDAASQLQSQGSESFGYDPHGNLTTWQNSRGIYTYTYNYENLLTGLTLPDRTTLGFTYDAFGRRLAVQGAGETRDFLYDGLDVILDGNSDLSQVTERYLYGDGLLVGRQATQTGFTAYHGDGLENVRFLADRNGRPFAAYGYDAFGRPAHAAGIDPNPFRFVGQHSVYQHGVPAWPTLLMGFRYYDPASGRFLTRDPWPGNLFDPQSLNDYAYASDNPVRYSDPTGLRRIRKSSCAHQDDSLCFEKGWQNLLAALLIRLLPPDQSTPWAVSLEFVGWAIAGQPSSGSSTANQSPAGQYYTWAFSPYRQWVPWLWWNPYDWWLWTEPPAGRRDTPPGIASMETDPVRWMPLTDDGSTYALACTANDYLLAGGFYAGLSRSTSPGHGTWSNVHAASVGEIAIASPSAYYAGTWYDGVLASTDGGASWAPSTNGLTANDVYALAADPATPAHLFAGTEMGLFASQDGGAHWGGPVGTLPGYLVSELAFAGSTLLAVTDWGLYRSTDGGAHWYTPTIDLPPARINVLLAGSPAGTIYAGTAQGPFTSSDGGDTWTSWGTGLANYDVHALAIDPADARRVVAGTTAGLFVSTNGGDTWAADPYEGLGGTASQVGALAFCPGGGDADLYLGTGNGVYALRTPVSPASVTIGGPVKGLAWITYTFTATVSPVTATMPITYVWQATGQSPVTNTGGGLIDTAAFAWHRSGQQTVTVTASNGVGTPVMGSHTMATVFGAYLPIVLRTY